MDNFEQSETLRRIIEVRYLVGFLGEKSQRNWWPTSFYDTSSIRFLEPVFSKTVPLAQYHGVVEAARRFHDEHLSVGSFHLFRLPEEMEQDLHETVQMVAIELFAPEKIVNLDMALSALTNGGGTTSENAKGPVLVGNIEDIRNANVLENIGTIYRAALETDAQVFPYMVG